MMMMMTELDPILVDFIPELECLIPPARVCDKVTYSPLINGQLHRALTEQDIGTLVVTGGETDICVLATPSGRRSWLQIILVKDALWSSAVKPTTRSFNS